MHWHACVSRSQDPYFIKKCCNHWTITGFNNLRNIHIRSLLYIYSLLLTCVQSSVVYLRQYDMMICTTESLVHICNETKVRNRSIQRVMGVKVNIALRKRTLSQKDLLWRIHLYAALCYSLMFLCWVKSNLLPFCTPDSQRTLTLNEYANEIVERATLDHYHHFHGHSRMCAWLAS